MYTDAEKTSIENPAELPPLELFTLAALVAESEQSTADRDIGISWCGGCGCHGLHLVATGIHDGDAVTLIAHDGIHVLRDMPVNAGGSAILNVLRCDAGHLIVGRTRIDGGRCYQAAEIYPITADQIAALGELTGGQVMSALHPFAPELVPVDVLMFFRGDDFDETHPAFVHLVGLDVHPDAEYTASRYRYCGLNLSIINETLGRRCRTFWHVAGPALENRQRKEADNLARAMRLVADAEARNTNKKKRNQKGITQ